VIAELLAGGKEIGVSRRTLQRAARKLASGKSITDHAALSGGGR
jgi:hypothetical protein